MSVLAVLGVEPADERAYRALVGRQAATLDELSAELGADREQLARSLALLETRGLVARSGGRHDRYVAAPPTVAIGALLNQHRAELRQVEVTLASLAETYRTAAGERALGDLIEVVSGADAIRFRADQIQRGATNEVLLFAVPPFRTGDRAEHAVSQDSALRRGVRYRTVVARALLEQPGAIERCRDVIGAGGRIRVVEHLPLNMMIADRTEALVPLADGAGTEGALLIHPSGVLDAVLALFEAVWAASVPLHLDVAEPAVPEEDPEALEGLDIQAIDARILSLLLVGLTDRSVASQLGLSMRTVQRRVRHLMDLAGVQTRLQLGWYAARNGWV